MTRVGILAYALDRAPGGIGRYTTELIRHLPVWGVTPTILATEPSGAFPAAVRIPMSARLPGLMTLGQLALPPLIKHKGITLFHDPTGVTPLLGTRVHRVVTIHDVVPFIYPATSSRLDWLIYRLWLPLILPQIDAIITDSQASKADILRHYALDPHKIHVIPCAATPDFRPLPAATVAAGLRSCGITFPYLLYVGSLQPRKNLLRLLEAYAHLRARGVHHRLVIVGARKWKSSAIAPLVEQLGLEGHVYFTGFIQDALLPALYNGATLFVFPSLYEGFGLPVLEAMACGTPVVTSSVSSLPEVAGTAACLIDPYDVMALTEALHALLGDPARREVLHHSGRERAATFSWAHTAQATAKVYQQLEHRG